MTIETLKRANEIELEIKNTQILEEEGSIEYVVQSISHGRLNGVDDETLNELRELVHRLNERNKAKIVRLQAELAAL